MASAQVETSVNTNNSPSQDYTTNPDDHSNHNIDSPGFKPYTVRRNYSCETALIKLTEDWRRSLDNKEIVCVVSMDLSKAFDNIPHSLLLAKLKAYGVNENSCALLGDYLSSMKQRVKIGDTFSEWGTVTRGVPQGSVLGPMFFNIFINDLFFHIKLVKLTAYADDEQLYNSDTDPG